MRWTAPKQIYFKEEHDCHFLKDQRSQDHGSYDIILCLSSEISPLLQGEFYLAILIWVSDHFWLISPNLFLPQTSYPTILPPTHSPFSQQWSVSSIIKKSSISCDFYSRLFLSLQTHLLLHSCFPPLPCVRNTYFSSYIRPALPLRLWIFLLQICRHQYWVSVSFFIFKSCLNIGSFPSAARPA